MGEVPAHTGAMPAQGLAGLGLGLISKGCSQAERKVTIVGNREWPPGRAWGGGLLSSLPDTSSWKKAEEG